MLCGDTTENDRYCVYLYITRSTELIPMWFVLLYESTVYWKTLTEYRPPERAVLFLSVKLMHSIDVGFIAEVVGTVVLTPGE